MLMMVGGVLNAVTSFFWFISLIWVCVGIFWLVPLAVGAWQAWVGYQMNSGQRQPSAKMAAIAGLVSGVFAMNPIPIVASLLAMTKVQKPEIVGYLGT
jgi:hypothetical protein